jgi:CPA2 family monovalent cation:H+ antiporter-2
LATPYLVRSADGTTRWFERRSPQVLLSSYNLYTRWARRFLESLEDTETKRILKRIAGQLALFYLLIAGALVMALFLSQTLPRLFPDGPAFKQYLDTGLWLLAMLSTLPIFVAAFRKMKALGMILAELGITERNVRTRNAEIRSIVSNGFLVFASLSLFLWVALLSSALLPGKNAAILLGGLLLLLAYFLRDPFHRMYSRCKDALVETLAHRHLEREAEEPETPGLLTVARLATLTVKAGDPFAGRLIGDTRMRTRTGASIVGIERDGLRIINPGPEEEIHVGDEIMLLGEDGQLEAVGRLMAGT